MVGGQYSMWPAVLGPEQSKEDILPRKKGEVVVGKSLAT